jgi:hypothetical protein
MAKVIVTIAPDDGMCFEDIMSFKTENHIGIWDSVEEKFMLVRESSYYFEPWYLDGYYKGLSELDEAVYNNCDEHILEVFDTSKYTITL